MLEKTIEKTFITAVKQAGGTTIKNNDPNQTGLPDRLILLPNGKHAFIEFKAPGKKPRPLQQHRINQLQKLGHHCYTLDTTNPDTITTILNEIQTT